jgi:preprotein translocase subunit YajC|tara:strand:- start:1259 stop:1627 length:369 start_codon:yes stop_codon:yes gene_type:complete
MFISQAFAQGAGGAGSADLLTSFLPLILIFAVFYFLLIRPQQKKAKQHKSMIAAVKRGDEVLTAGGLYAKVTKVVDDLVVELELAEGVKVRAAKHTLGDVLNRSAGDAPKAESKKSKTLAKD